MSRVTAAASVIGACLLSSCATVGLMVDHAPVSGQVNAVSIADIHEAIAAAKSSPDHPGVSSPYAIEIRNRDEIYLYITPGGEQFDYVKRERGKWRYQSNGLSLTHFIPANGH
jgi:hypothetical protein